MQNKTRFEEIYNAALQQPAERRADYMRVACNGDRELLRDLESLLAYDVECPASELAAPVLTCGDVLGNFRILGQLGKGGMGEVYRGRDVRLNRDVAIKLLPPVFAADRNRVARFEREARAASALNHPNILSVYDIGCDKGILFIVSEFVEGDTLAQVLGKRPLTLPKLIDIGAQIAAGLAAAHVAGVIHRDLKPANIVLGPGGRAKILDFGLAAQQHLTGQTSTTLEISTPGLIMGTPGYMSPEQIRGQPADARSDLFSLGIILYEMALGRPAFPGDSSLERVISTLKDDLPVLPPAFPPSLDRIIRRCLEKDPADRFQGAADLRFALESLVAPGTLASNKRSSRRLLWGIAGVAVCACIGVIAYQVRSTSDRKNGGLANATMRRLTTDAGISTQAAISSDGRLIAYASDRAEAGNLDIWVQQVEGGGVVRLTDDAKDDYEPAFSPDGALVAFSSDRKDSGIYAVPTIGGEARLLIPGGRRPRYSPDGRQMLYWTGPRNPSDVRGSLDVTLFVQPTSGGTAIQIGTGCRMFEQTPVWSPDASRILFLAACGSEAIKAWVYSVNGKALGANEQLAKLWLNTHSKPIISQWAPTPPRLIIPMLAGDATAIAAFPISADGLRVTGPPLRINLSTDQATAQVAENGRIAISSIDSTFHSWTVPLNEAMTAAGAPQQINSGPAPDTFRALSRDGQKIAFISSRSESLRLFYKDLRSGKQREVSTGGFRYETPVFSPDGTKILCEQYPEKGSWGDFMFEVPLNGGMARRVWDREKWSVLWDWSPDGSTVLYLDYPSWRDQAIKELDLASLSSTVFLRGAEYMVRQAHFSNKGNWVTFEGEKNGRSRIFLAPFRKAEVPLREWIPITDGVWDGKPHFSSDDTVVFFTSAADGFRCVWAQRLSAAMHPEGKPWPVYHSHDRRRSLGEIGDYGSELGIAPNAIFFTIWEQRGNIWLFEPSATAQ